ncbi:hypothetical protein LCGC14_1031350 [marine sediment metagenome]|uniref:Uncharacterized protein n=1 Tax=marine sediment metagenome TaxID=412755 RepID=A0A0F9MUG0_9ZZZZ
MCTKFLGDGLCCGYDCYEETPMKPVNSDPDAWEKYVNEGMYSLGNELSFLRATQEDADIAEDDDWGEDQLGIIYPPEEGEIGEEILHA